MLERTIASDVAGFWNIDDYMCILGQLSHYQFPKPIDPAKPTDKLEVSNTPQTSACSPIASASSSSM